MHREYLHLGKGVVMVPSYQILRLVRFSTQLLFAACLACAFVPRAYALNQCVRDGGQFRSLHGTFEGEFGIKIDMYDGTMTFTRKLASTPGRHGFGASVSVIYNQLRSRCEQWDLESEQNVLGRSPSPLGQSWYLSLPEIDLYSIYRTADGTEYEHKSSAPYEVPALSARYGTPSGTGLLFPSGDQIRFRNFITGESAVRDGQPVSHIINTLGDTVQYLYNTSGGYLVPPCTLVVTNTGHKIRLTDWTYNSSPYTTLHQGHELHKVITKGTYNALNDNYFSDSTLLFYAREGSPDRDSNSLDGNPLWKIKKGDALEIFYYTDDIDSAHGYAGRLINEIVHPTGAHSEFDYDSMSRVEEYRVLANGSTYTWQFQYITGSTQCTTLVTDPDGIITRYVHLVDSTYTGYIDNCSSPKIWLLKSTERFPGGDTSATALSKSVVEWTAVSNWPCVARTTTYADGMKINAVGLESYHQRIRTPAVTKLYDGLDTVRSTVTDYRRFDSTKHFLYVDSTTKAMGSITRRSKISYDTTMGLRIPPPLQLKALYGSSDTLTVSMTLSYDAKLNVDSIFTPRGTVLRSFYDSIGLFQTQNAAGFVFNRSLSTGFLKSTDRPGMTAPYRDSVTSDETDSLTQLSARLVGSSPIYERWTNQTGLYDSAWSWVDTSSTKTTVRYFDQLLRPCSTLTRTTISLSGADTSWALTRYKYIGWAKGAAVSVPRAPSVYDTTFLDALGRNYKTKLALGRTDSAKWSGLTSTRWQGTRKSVVVSDFAGRTTLSAGPIGDTTRFYYRADGLLDSVKNPVGQITRYVYNSRDLLLSAHRVDRVAQYSYYDSNGDLRFARDSAGTWSYVKYDSLDRTIEVGTWSGPPDEVETKMVIRADSVNYPSSGTTMRTKYVYAGADLDSVRSVDAGVSYGYSANDWGTTTEKRVKFDSLSGTYIYRAKYNSANTLKSFEYPMDGVPDPEDGDNRGVAQYFSYYPDGNMKSTWVCPWVAGGFGIYSVDTTKKIFTLSRTKGFTYDSLGYPDRINYADTMTSSNSIRCQFGWDDYGRPTGRMWGKDESFANQLFGYILRYDSSGYGLDKIDTTYDAGATFSWALEADYTFDDAQRLVADSVKGRAKNTYTYDKVGNFDYKGSNLYYYVSGTNKLKGIATSATKFVYDANGCLIGDSVRSHFFTRNWRGEATRIDLAKDSNNKNRWMLNWFDANGKRVRVQHHYYYKWCCGIGDPDLVGGGGEEESSSEDSLGESSMEGGLEESSSGPGGCEHWCYDEKTLDRYYLWWENTSPVILDTAGDAVEAVGIYAKGERLWELTDVKNHPPDSAKKEIMCNDHLGTQRRAIELPGNTISRAYNYDVWGKHLVVSGSEASPYTFTGQEWEDFASLGLFYYGARWYDPERGRFESPDPVYSPLASPYGYVENDPVEKNDPTGMTSRYGGGYMSYGMWLNMYREATKERWIARGEVELRESRSRDPFEWTNDNPDAANRTNSQRLADAIDYLNDNAVSDSREYKDHLKDFVELAGTDLGMTDAQKNMALYMIEKFEFVEGLTNETGDWAQSFHDKATDKDFVLVDASFSGFISPAVLLTILFHETYHQVEKIDEGDEHKIEEPVRDFFDKIYDVEGYFPRIVGNKAEKDFKDKVQWNKKGWVP